MTLSKAISAAQVQKFFSSEGAEVELWLRLLSERVTALAGDVYTPDTGAVLAHFSAPNVGEYQSISVEVLQQVAASGQGTLVEGARIVALYPVSQRGQCYAVVALYFDSIDNEKLANILIEIQWASAWLALNHSGVEIDRLERRLSDNALLLEVMAEGLAETTFSQTLGALLHRISELFNADRVYLGTASRRRGRILQATGFTAPKQRTEDVRAIEDAMVESYDQNQLVSAPVSSSNLITRAHRHILSTKGVAAVASLPLKNAQGKARFVLLLERDVGEPFNAGELDLLASLGVYLAPLVELKDRDNRPLLSLIAARVFGRARGMVKPLLYVAATAGLLYLSISVRVPLTINGDALLQTSGVQAVSAPFAGYIERVDVVPGDSVREGQLLAKLESRDLELERVKVQSELVRLENSLQEAIGSFDRKKQRSVESEIQIKRGELTLLQSKIDRTSLKAPFDATVLEGDLRQRIGGQLTVGELLLTLAPKDSFHIQVRVPEHEIAHVGLGTTGNLFLNAIPHSQWGLSVERIFPTSTVDEAGAVFIVEASIDDDTELLKSGLRGVAKFDVGETSLLNRLTRDWQQWAKERWWAFWG